MLNIMSETDFSFVSDSRYRQILENDYSEIVKCIEVDCYKSATTIAGSLIEALLTDFILDTGTKTIPNITRGGNVKTEDAGLHNIIDFCHQNNFVTTRVYHLLESMRDFRNLIHPAKAVRMEIQIKKENAILYKSTLDIIISEVSKKRQTELGSTAEQLLHFMVSDDHAVELFSHMVKKANNEEERKKYLLHIATKQLISDETEYGRYFGEDGPNFDSIEEEEYCEHLSMRLDNVAASYHICFSNSNIETKRCAALKMIEILRYGTHTEKNTYNRLFEEEFMELIQPIDKEFLAEYLVLNAKILKQTQFNKILNCLSKQLSKEKRHKLFETAIYMIKVRRFKNINDSLVNYIKEVKGLDPQQYNEFIQIISGLIINIAEPEVIQLNDLMSDVLTKLGEVVPPYVPF